MGKSIQRTVRERLVWWKYPPKPEQTDSDIEWGWLIFFNDGDCEFRDERPSDNEIAMRTTCLLPTERNQEVDVTKQ